MNRTLETTELLRDQVLVKRDEAEKKSALILMEDLTPKPNTGVVVSVSPKCESVKVGDRVAFGGWATGKQLPVGAETFLLMSEEQDILAILH